MEIPNRSTILTYLIDLKGIIRQQFLPICGVAIGTHYNILNRTKPVQVTNCYRVHFYLFVGVDKLRFVFHSIDHDNTNTERKQNDQGRD